MTRRSFLAALLTVAAAGPVAAAAPSPSLDEFLALSSALAEVPRERLDRKAAALYLQSLRSWAGKGDLAMMARAAGRPPSLAALERSGVLAHPRRRRLAEAILECWYTGVYETPKGLRVATFPGALAWDALAGVNPPTVCGRT